MSNKLEKRYGLFVAMAMVVGIVIGSGVFFKAEKVLSSTGGDLPMGILAWIIGGIIMVSCAYTFAILATKYEKVNGVVDYAEAVVGEGYGYMVSWFVATIYYPTLTSVLAWVSARFTCVLIGWDIVGPECMVIALFYLVGSYGLNALSPVLAGKFQVTATVIKLIPLVLMAIVGTIVGLGNGMTVANFTTVVQPVESPVTALFTAVVATSFAYDGWIVATSINTELRDARKNLPKALLGGTLIVMVVYIAYYIGLAGAVSNETMMAGGQEGAKLAFETIFSKTAGSLLFVFVIISCLGTLNGLMVGCTRGLYAVAIRGRGPRPEVFAQVDDKTNMPTNSAVMGLVLAAFWFMFFYGANLTAPWFGPLGFDTSELPIVAIYFMYIPIFFLMIKKEEGFGTFKGKVVPSIAILGAAFMVIAAIFSHKMAVFSFLALFVVFMLPGMLTSKVKEIN